MAARPVGVEDRRVVEALAVRSCCAGRAVWRGASLTAAGLTPTQFGVLERFCTRGPLGQRDLSQVLTSAGT